MSAKKITKKDRYTTLLTYAEVKANADMVKFIEHEIELLNKKSSSNGEKKVNEKMEKARTEVLAYMQGVDKVTVADIKELLSSPNTQFPTSVLTSLGVDHGTGQIKREVVKGKSYYSLV